MINPIEKTILVVDDEPDLRAAIAFDFKRQGFNVLEAGNGREAISVIETQNVNLVISDVRMPGGDGIELLDKLKDKNVFFPVLLFITGFSDMSHAEAYHRGAEAIFSKPFDRQKLRTAVLRALEPLANRIARENIRIEADTPVGLRFLGSGVAINTTILNFGRGGMFVRLQDHFPDDQEKVEFRMELPYEPPILISGQGTVRWIRRENSVELPAGCGIEFNSLDHKGMERFLEAIHQLSMKPFIPMR